MHPQVSVARDGIVVAQGYGIKIYVERRHLVVHDGICDERQTRRYHRVTSKLERLLVVGHTGFLSFEAIRWLRDARAALVHLDIGGELLSTSVASRPDLAGLRRAQALATTSDVGVELARSVLAAKVAGQRAVVAELSDSAEHVVAAVEHAAARIALAETLPDLLLAESHAAEAYWDAWSTLRIPFHDKHTKNIPAHWHQFGQRSSILAQGPRLATDPANAILNYLYALLEAETTLACHAVGLDPGIGIFHTDQRDRDSLALDLMEAVRPIVDSYVLALLTQRTLNPKDFAETRQGVCRLAPDLAGELAQTVPAWRRHVAPVVEHAAHTLAESASSKLPRLTPLTRHNHRAAWDQRDPDRKTRLPRTGHLTLPNVCRSCGDAVPDRRRRYCDQCRRDQSTAAIARGRDKAAAVLASLRAEQRDPAHGGRAAQIRGSKNAAHQLAVAAWIGERPDPVVFTAEILPGLRNLSVPALMAATGLGQHYCSLIRLGKTVPHPRHWKAFRDVAR